MKKFTNYELNTEDKNKSINSFVNKLLKENITLEVSGKEKPWSEDIEFKSKDELVSTLEDYIETEKNKSNLELLEKIRTYYYSNNSLDSIDDEIRNVRKKLNK